MNDQELRVQAEINALSTSRGNELPSTQDLGVKMCLECHPDVDPFKATEDGRFIIDTPCAKHRVGDGWTKEDYEVANGRSDGERIQFGMQVGGDSVGGRQFAEWQRGGDS